jgi:4-amino-4-deoxy-L-arabinose transferase-like glycosyltransferase
VRLSLLMILLFGALLRFHALAEDVRFHPDEALFATFARNAAVHGEWMLPGALDKTPLSIYAAALSMHLTAVYVNEKQVLDLDLRQGETAARLPNAFAGIVLIALVYILGRTLHDEATGLFAALLTAISPQLVAFSATSFTDMLMLTLCVASLTMAARKRFAWSGLWLALAIWAKQQGVFYLPLVLWQVYSHQKGVNWRALLRFRLSFAAGIALLLLWDAARQQTSLFALAAANNNPERFFIRADEILPRLFTWLSYSMTFFGVGWLTIPLVLIGLWGIIHKPVRFLLLYIAAYFALHWLVAFNTYDRYLLLLIPPLAVIVGNGIRVKSATLRSMLICGLMLLTVFTPLRYPTDSRAQDGEIIALADYLNAKPLGAIIYDHWLGWEMGYYLGPWSDKRRVYYPDPEIQAEDALLNPDPAPRYFIAPREVETGAWLDAFRAKGFDVALEWTNTRYLVYRITPAWCC